MLRYRLLVGCSRKELGDARYKANSQHAQAWKVQRGLSFMSMSCVIRRCGCDTLYGCRQ